MLVWNDLAGGDGDYCAILVAFNSVLQMVLYAPFAIFYIDVVEPPNEPGEVPDADDVEVNYAVVARSVAVFLGLAPSRFIASFNVSRYTSGRRNPNTICIAPTSRAPALSTKVHQMDCSNVTHRPYFHNHHSFRIPGPKCC